MTQRAIAHFGRGREDCCSVCGVRFLIPFIVFAALMALCYRHVGRKMPPGDGVALVLGLCAIAPLIDGIRLLVREYDRIQDGRVISGVVTGKLSSSGAAGSRTIGGVWHGRASGRVPAVVTTEGARLDDVAARLLVTGSPDVWMVEYRYACSRHGECRRRESVSQVLWSGLEVGGTVAVRVANGQTDAGRLDGNSPWSIAAAKLTLAGTLAGLAGFVSGRLFRRRPTLVEAPAVVTSVEAIQAGEQVRWRVGFAYLSAGGAAYENTDEVYQPGLAPGDDCTALYPADKPDLGTLVWPPRSST